MTKSYDPGDLKNKRMEWNVAEINNPHLHFGNYQILLNKLRTIEKEMKNLPRSKESYGLIHYDFHPYNFLIDQGKITVFDFDDSLYGWFALDIGIAATHAVWWGSDYKAWGSKHEFAKHFLNEFLEGYIKQNSMGKNGSRGSLCLWNIEILVPSFGGLTIGMGRKRILLIFKRMLLLKR